VSVEIPGIPIVPPSVTLPSIVAFGTQAISSALWQASQQPPSWGVFDHSDGTQVLFPDSVLEFSQRREFDISDFPVQAGSFASYNKVIRPNEVHLRFSKGGSIDDRADFLASLEQLAQSLTLVDVVTLETLYPSLNLQRFEVARRGARGAYFLTEVDAYFIQIIEVQAQYTSTSVQTPNAQSEAAQPTSSVGAVQPQNPDSQLQQDGQLALSTQAQFPGGY
jgi:hypothetical protein